MKIATRSVEELEKERMALFERYLQIEEQLDDINRQKYELCCHIEKLNQELKLAIEQREKEQAKAAGQSGAPAPPQGT